MNLDWISVLKITGPFGLFAGILTLFIWKVLIPENRKANDKIVEILQKELDNTRSMLTNNTDKFNSTIEGSLKEVKTVVMDLGTTLQAMTNRQPNNKLNRNTRGK